MASIATSPRDQIASETPLRRRADDKDMLRLAATLARELAVPSKAIYWSDMLGSALLGYAGLALAMFSGSLWLAAAGWLVAVLALYRAGLFIHELTHVTHRYLPGFRLGWNIVVGIPLMLPSFMYEGLHNLHHAKTRYGTQDDPEYLPLALMKPWSLPVFVAVAALAPIGQFLRFAILGPLSLVIPPLRRLVVAKYSGLIINPGFARRVAEGDERRRWLAQEVAVSIWAMALLGGVISGLVPLQPFLIFMSVISGIVVLNQVRTLVAHLWENDWADEGGQEMTVTGQYLDSVNVSGGGFLAELWAPVGLRYHALHHLLPSVPYHALPAAHRRLVAELPEASAYHGANYPGLSGLVAGLFGKTQKR